jgi:hypothetical protein
MRCFPIPKLFRRPPTTTRPRTRLFLEALEDRLTPSTAVDLPGLQSVMDNATLVFSAANQNAITVTGGDSSSETVYVQATSGTLKVANTAGLSIYSNGAGLIGLTGTETQIDAALNGLVYTPQANFSGSVTLEVLVHNANNQDVSGMTTISVAQPTGPISVTLPTGALQVNDNAKLVFSAANQNAITVRATGTGDDDAQDSDDTQLTVFVQVGAGTLTLGSTQSVTGVTGNGTSMVGLTGTAAQINTALNGLTYTPPALFSGPVFLSVFALTNGEKPGDDDKGNGHNKGDNDHDGGFRTASGTVTIMVNAATSALSVNGPLQQQVAGTQSITFSTANGNPITLTDADANGGTDTVYVQALHGTFTATAATGAQVNGNGSSMLTLTGTLPALNATLDGLTYTASAGTTTDIVSVMILDTDAASGPVQSANLNVAVTVNANATDVAPTVAGPLGNQISTATGLAFSQANGNAITLSDADANGATETVYVQTLHGSLTAGTGTGGAQVSGNGTALLTLTGTVAQINTSLNGLSYVPGTGTRIDFISVLASDGQRVGTFGMTITVANAAQLPPQVFLPDDQGAGDDREIHFRRGHGNGIHIADIDNDGATETLYLQVLHGRIRIGDTAELTISGNGTSLITVTGTVSAVNAALDSLDFGMAQGAGSDWLNVLLESNGSGESTSAGLELSGRHS